MFDAEYSDCFKELPWDTSALVNVLLPLIPCLFLFASILVQTFLVKEDWNPKQNRLQRITISCFTGLAAALQVFCGTVCLKEQLLYRGLSHLIVSVALFVAAAFQFRPKLKNKDFTDVAQCFIILQSLWISAKLVHIYVYFQDSDITLNCWSLSIPNVVILCEAAAVVLLALVIFAFTYSYGDVKKVDEKAECVSIRKIGNGTERQNSTAAYCSAARTNACPEQSAPLLSRIFFHWFTSLVWTGFKNPLEEQNLWSLNDEDYVLRQSAAFNKNLEVEFPTKRPQFRKDGRKGSVLRALVKTFWAPCLVGTICRFASDCLLYANPILMKCILRFLKSDESQWFGISYTLGMLLCSTIQSCFSNFYLHRMFVVGMRIRAVVVAAIYEKSLRLSSTSRRNLTVGEIVNLMSNDSQKFLDVMRLLNMIWAAPFQITVSFLLISVDMGSAVFAGFFVLLLLLPSSILLASMQKGRQADQMKDKDQRIKMMSEILNGIKVLKLYAWELGFKKVVDAIRVKEISKLSKIAILQSFLTLIWFLAPFVISLATFAAFVFLNPDKVLTSDIAFVALAIFQSLRIPLTMLPNLISTLVQISVSLKRIDSFMAAEELDEYVTKESSTEAIRVENGDFGWEGDSATLQQINLNIPQGDLVAVVGQVGTGKSSLISAILGDMKLISGSVNVSGRIAYVSQQAWLRNASLRDNILFGNPFVHEKYWDVVRRCALIEDLQMLPAGDMTEIGEKGVNLSGGQKQRISIARAVYADADIYLLDDPLSALDSHVGVHIFNEVIGGHGILNSKTRLLVTHGIQYLPKVNRVVLLKDGRIEQDGPYEDLMNTNEDFRNLIHQFSQQDDSEAIVEEEKRIRKQSARRSESKISQSNLLKGKIMEKEFTETGGVKKDIYCQYIRYAGIFSTVMVFLSMFISNAFQVGSSFWLADWSRDKDTENAEFRLGIYSVFILGQAIFLFSSVLLLVLSALGAAKKLHNRLLLSILRCPMSFFDSTPIGRIVNRFARDIDVVDQNVSQSARVWLQQMVQLCSIMFVICYNVPLFFAVIVPLAGVYFLIQASYVSASRQLRRLESITRSPIYSHFSETLQGTTVIRAFGVAKQFIDESNVIIDRNQACYYPRICGNRWLGIRLDICGTLITFFTGFLIVLNRGNTDAGVAGLCLAYALTALGALNGFIRSSVDIEVDVVSVERILEYVNLDSEDEWQRNSPPESWPSKGAVEFKNYSTRYRPKLPLVVNSINMKISPGEKVGICGRTGAGKSSLTLALFRLIEASEGDILIDGQSIGKIGLHDLRKQLSIIPQDPILFSGSLRLNLDPFKTKTDEQLWDALEHAHLKSYVVQLEKGLDADINEGGENLSVGQRQLVCLARALLRKSRILVLDEATAAVDVETDSLIQETIRREFAESTIITIAHRVNTIINYDKILVLDAGKLREFDRPENLLDDPNSLFSLIVKDSKTK